MKLAILLLCHKNPEQINLFLETLHHPDIEFFIHVDKKTNMHLGGANCPDVHVLPDNLRVDVKWSGFSMIEATLNLLHEAHKMKKFDYYWLCSGQDFPIQSPENIIQYFTDHTGSNFATLWPSYHYQSDHHDTHLDKRNRISYPSWMMGRHLLQRVMKRIYVEVTGGWTHTYKIFCRHDRFSMIPFYFGPQWIALHDDCVSWLLAYLKQNPWYEAGYRESLTPDESFFHTLLMLSPYANTRMDYLHYIDWYTPRKGKSKNSPNTLLLEDYDKIISSRRLMARKFDTKIDQKIIEKLHDKILDDTSRL